jgi:hypothetical protein
MQAVASFQALKSLVHAPSPDWRTIIAVLGGTTFTPLCNAKEIAEVLTGIVSLIIG